MFLSIISKTKRLKNTTEKHLEKYSRPTVNFFVLISLSAALATLGLLANNTAVVIGAMVVAPLITPIYGFALSTLIFKINKIFFAAISILLGSGLAIVVSFAVSWLIKLILPEYSQITNEVVNRTSPNIVYFFIAFFSGLAGAFTYHREENTEKFEGIAIAVAIIPPLSVIGMSLAIQNWEIVQKSSLLFIFNLIGILLGSILMFLILGFGKEK